MTSTIKPIYWRVEHYYGDGWNPYSLLLAYFDKEPDTIALGWNREPDFDGKPVFSKRVPYGYRLP